MDADTIREKIDKILEKRKEMLPKIEEREQGLRKRWSNLELLRGQIKNIKCLEKDSSRTEVLDGLIHDIEEYVGEISQDVEAAHNLRGRFSRDAVCIGVSGMARVGKSTTLQKMSGLTNEQIPTGDRKNVTAVHSIIHNESKGKPQAKISFMSEGEFLDTYISSLVASINEGMPDDKQIADPSSLQDLKDMNIPATLGETTTPTAGDSLLRLHEAQDCIDSYEDCLGRPDQTIVLEGDNLKEYVAYPDKEGEDANRKYLAVKGVDIYCPFPSIPGVRLSLVDLPGFGEINEGVAEKHIAALNKNVDHILDILKPTDTSGSFTSFDASAIDLLYGVLPDITSRRSLITVGINVIESYAPNARQLEKDFNERFNNAQEDPLHVEQFHANNEEEVSGLFGIILDNLASDLPRMDQDLLDAAAGMRDAKDHDELFERIKKSLGELASTIPLPEAVLNDAIGDISRSVIEGCQQYEYQLLENARAESEYKKQFNEQVDACCQSVEEGLAGGFFLGEDEWVRSAPSGDYYSQYRQEARRIRREIIARYEQLNVFYSDNCEDFKAKALEMAFAPFGNLLDELGVDMERGADCEIGSLRSALSPFVRGSGVLPALDLLESVRFNFRHNVFLNIAPCLDELLNPYKRDAKNAKDANAIQVALGGIDNPREQIEYLHNELLKIGQRANKEVRDALKSSEDRFFEYLSVCMSFFNDFLWRQNEDSYKQVVVRKLVGEFPDAIIGERASFSRDEERAKGYAEAIRLAADIQRNPVSKLVASSIDREFAKSRRRSANRGANASSGGKLKQVHIGEEFEGEVTKVVKSGAFVSTPGNRDGFVPARTMRSYFGESFVDVSKCLPVGMNVKVRVDGIKEDGKIDLLLVK